MRDGCAHYLQTEEWCTWAEEEVAPALREALSRHRSSVESVELPGDEAVASIYINVHGDREFDDWKVELSAGAHDLFTASTVRSLIAAAVEREREECAKVCDGVYYQHIGPLHGEVRYGIAKCAAAIRARGEK